MTRAELIGCLRRWDHLTNKQAWAAADMLEADGEARALLAEVVALAEHELRNGRAAIDITRGHLARLQRAVQS